jgi:hypothetical protein
MASLGAAFFLASGLTVLWQFYLFIGVLVGIGVSMNGMVPRPHCSVAGTASGSRAP